jgi:hypothetical protein
MTEKNAKDIWLEHIESHGTKGTLQIYKSGFSRFELWLGENSDRILEMRKADIDSKDPLRMRRFNDLIEKFHKDLLEGRVHMNDKTTEDSEKKAPNTARTIANSVNQFFNFYAMPTKVSFPSTKTGKTAIPTVDEWRGLFNVADLRGKVALSLGLDLAWRIGDFANIKVKDLGDLTLECPVQIERLTAKEKELSSTFISCETVELLKVYLPTLRTTNEWLFQTKSNGSHLDAENFEAILQDMGFKAGYCDKDGVVLNGRSKGKNLTWHSFRKTFLTMATNLEIDPDTKCILTGKSLAKGQSMETYLGDIRLKNAFLKVRNALALNRTQQVETQADEIAQLKAVVVEQAQKLANQETTIKTLTEKINELSFGQKTMQRLMMDIDERLVRIENKKKIKDKVPIS